VPIADALSLPTTGMIARKCAAEAIASTFMITSKVVITTAHVQLIVARNAPPVRIMGTSFARVASV
jgi:hypothetical protein